MLSARHRHRALLGVFAAALLAVTGIVGLAADGSAATGITITSGPCSDGGTSFCFNPEVASAVTGAPVTWTDQSGVAHAIAPCIPTACPGAPANTGTNTFDVAVPADGHGSFTFTSPGTYFYFCTIHGYTAMHGSIVVTSVATSPPSPSATPRPTSHPTAKPTHEPVMQSASPRTTRSPSVTSAAHVTPGKASTPSESTTPNATRSTGGNASPPTPSPRSAIALVSPGGSPAVPIALVITVLACVGFAAALSLRRRNRQAG
jgi:plastocyanin